MQIVEATIVYDPGHPEAIITRIGNQVGQAFIRVFPQRSYQQQDIYTMPYLSISMKGAAAFGTLLIIRSHGSEYHITEYDRLILRYTDGTYTELQITATQPVGAVKWAWASIYSDQLGAIATKEVDRIEYIPRNQYPVIFDFLPNETYANKEEGKVLIPLMARRIIGAIEMMRGQSDYARLS